MNGGELVSNGGRNFIISVNLHPVFLASDEAAGSMSLILRFYF